MPKDNDLINHILKTKRVVAEWPEWKRNLLGTLENTGKVLKDSNYQNLPQLQTSSKK